MRANMLALANRNYKICGSIYCSIKRAFTASELIGSTAKRENITATKAIMVFTRAKAVQYRIHLWKRLLMEDICFSLVLKKIALGVIFCAGLGPAVFARDVDIVAIPERISPEEGETVGIYIQIKNLLANETLSLMGGMKSKKGIIYPTSCEYELKLYEMKNGSIVENFASTGFLPQKIPSTDFDSKFTILKLKSYQTACYFIEIVPFPKGKKQSGKYCVITLRIPTNKESHKITINLERKVALRQIK